MVEHQPRRSSGLPSERVPYSKTTDVDGKHLEEAGTDEHNLDSQSSSTDHLPPHSRCSHLLGEELPVTLPSTTTCRL